MKLSLQNLFVNPFFRPFQERTHKEKGIIIAALAAGIFILIALTYRVVRTLQAERFSKPTEKKHTEEKIKKETQEETIVSGNTNVQQKQGINTQNAIQFIRKRNTGKSQTLNQILNLWVSTAPENEEKSRERVRERIHQAIEEKLELLDLSNMNLTSLPKIFENEKLAHIKKINLSSNRLEQLPVSITALKNLEELNISNNRFKELQKEIFNLNGLTSLNISGNLAISLPETIENFKELRHLDISYIGLKEIPHWVWNLEKLISLNISGNGLGTLSEEISNLQELKTLDLSNNSLKSLPNEIGLLKQLRELDLSINKLTKLPDSLTELAELNTLDLSKNQLTFLPDQINRLKKLVHLDFSKNQLNHFPKGIVELINLTSLNISENVMTELPEQIGQLNRLTFLDASCNKFVTLPDEIGDLKNLESLKLFFNEFKVLPDTIVQLKKLKHLDLHLNLLEILPKKLSQLTALEHLDLSNNQLQALPKKIEALQNLKKLLIFSNMIETLPSQIHLFQRLNLLNAGDNSFAEVPGSIYKLPQSCKVDVRNCKLEAVVMEEIQETMEESNYAGPLIAYEIIQESKENNKKAIQLVNVLQKSYPFLTESTLRKLLATISEEDQLKLTEWLGRLADMNDAKEKETWVFLQNKVVEYLNLASNDRSFRHLFLILIAEALGTCGDRMTLYILKIGIECKLAQLKKKIKEKKKTNAFGKEDFVEAADLLLKGRWIIGKLEKGAQEKIEKINKTGLKCDEIEIYLGFPVKLKERLKLPIDVSEMLYFQTSNIKEKELDHAAKEIEETPIETKAQFLITQDLWLEALKGSELFEIIEKEKEKALDVDEPDYQEITETYNKALTKLTLGLIEAK